MIARSFIRTGSAPGGALLLAILLGLPVSAAHAGPTARVSVSGHVAARCWSVRQPNRVQAAIAIDPAVMRARCTLGRPQLAMRTFDIGAPNVGAVALDGKSPASRSPHMALEIVVSPHL
ncbi:hypothetical protein [Sphingomonas japonica]|uniref:Uncharacterized protein n=1 Tax=Sphingomonas japonica TaxID=511662 RepID=A0ABX0TXW4_9SPHN|nr:hypothetical protein [Sphingomonas japonica]NIJ23159.1 hypothetical protein [Sphingomonas japonica]